MAEKKLSPQKHEVKEKCLQVEYDDPNHEDEAEQILHVIADRIDRDDFPPVLKELQSAVSSAEAADLLEWLSRAEHAKFKNYLKQKYTQQRRNARVEDEPENVFRARWFRDTYYLLLKEYHHEFIKENAIIDSLKAMLGKRELPTEARSRFLQLLREDKHLQHITSTNFEKFIDEFWSQHVTSCQQSIQKHIAHDPQKFKELWLFHACTLDTEKFLSLWRYFVLQSKVSDLVPTLVFVPALWPTEMPTTKSQAWAQTVMSRLPIALRSMVVESTTEELQSFRVANMEFANTADLEKHFLRKFYYENMEKIIIANQEDNVHFVPEVPISIIESPREQSAVEITIHNATSMDVKKFEELLGKRKRESLS